MLLDASASGTMNNKTTTEIQESVDNMSLNEYWSQGDNMDVINKQGVLSLVKTSLFSLYVFDDVP